MGLVPFDLDRLVDEVERLVGDLDVLIQAEEVAAAEKLDPIQAQAIIGVGVTFEEAATMDAESRAALFTLEEYQEIAFEFAWSAVPITLRRIGMLLNDGDTDILDCNQLILFTLRRLWHAVDSLPRQKPTFVFGGPQEFAAQYGAGVEIADCLRILRREKQYLSGDAPQDDRDDDEPADGRFKPPKCRRCSEKTSVTRTKGAIRYLKCASCGWTGKAANSSSSSME